MRKAGILLPISSLPSPYGVGTLGKSAYDFVDFLAEAGQSWWQILPVGPTSYGDSPYQSFSAFAGNPYFIDLDILAGNGLITKEDIGTDWGADPGRVDYALLFKKRFDVLTKAAFRQNKTAPDYLDFVRENADWLDDYAMFMALKEAYNNVGFTEWPEALRTRQPAALKLAEAKWGPRIEFWRCTQYFFFRQWKALRLYANARGVEIVGDIPIYISPDSSELWAHPELFQTTPDGRPSAVAGVPPDMFSATGQLWGNPLYDWKYHKKTKYEWWIRRMQYSAQLYDVLRIDHFRGFAGYYAIPADAVDASIGEWRPGPGKSLIRAFHKNLDGLQIIAEDLGFLTEEVFALLVYSGYPGMKILQFAFDSRDESDYLPHNYLRHTVVYTGTHDNTTLKDWQKSALPDDVAFARHYYGLPKGQSLPKAMMRSAMSCVADNCVIPMPDWLGLGIEGRINTPSTLGGRNWQWRLKAEDLTSELAEKIRDWTKMYGRLSQAEREKEGYAARVAESASIYERAMQSFVEKTEEKAALLPPPEPTELAPADQEAALQAGIPPAQEIAVSQEDKTGE